MKKIIELLMYVPLLPQLVLTVIFYLTAKALGSTKDKAKILLLSLAGSFVLWGAFITAVTWSQGKYVIWFIFVYLTIVAILLTFLKLRTSHKIPKALLCTAIVYALFLICFSGVRRPLTERLTWEITGKTETPGMLAEKQITFRFVNFPNHFQQVYSNTLATKLIEKQSKEVEGNFTLYYNWGDFAGHHLDSVDEYQIPSAEGGGAGTTGADDPSPFPKIFLGPKKFW